MTHHIVDATEEVVETLATLVKMRIEETQAENSDYEIAMKLPRYFLDAGYQNIAAKAYSRLWIDYGLSAVQQREEAQSRLAERPDPTTEGTRSLADTEQIGESFVDRALATRRFIRERARKVLNDPRFAEGVGDTQIKTMIAVKGIRG